MPVKLSFKAKGHKQALDLVARRIKRLDDIQTPLRQIVEDYFDIESRWFNSEGGGKWKPLSPRYAAQKRKVAPGAKILVLSGLMSDQFTGRTRRGVRFRRDAVTIRVIGAP